MNNADKDKTVAKWPEHLTGMDPAKVQWKLKDDDYWRSVLSPEQFEVCRKAGTERPFSGQYCVSELKGAYACSSCGLKLFSSDSKFDSGTGWPSFNQAADDGAIIYIEDRSSAMVRTEVRCARCDAHLGHVFDDGPPPSGKRFCINSLCLIHAEK